MKKSAGILLALLITAINFAQQATDWKNYTNMQSVQSVITSGNEIWAATSGGGFSFDPVKDIYKTLHRTDGLNGINLTAITVDNYGKIWFGSGEGVIDVYNPADNSVKSILDIYNSDYTVKKVTELKAEGDTIFVSTNFGVSLIDAKKLILLDTYFKFGGLTSNTQVNSIIKPGLIYAATALGLAVQKQGTTNLSAPESWTVYTSSDGLPNDSVTKLISYNNSIIAGTKNGLAISNGNSWQSFLPQINGIVNDLGVYNDSLYILVNNRIYVCYNNSLANTYSLPVQANAVAYSANLGILAATASNGIIQVNSNQSPSISPNGPASNFFNSMSVDNNGNLWCASGSDAILKGFYKFNGSTWTNYNTSTYKGLLSNAFYDIYAAPNNIIYVGNWGRGFTEVNGDSLITFYLNNTGLFGSDWARGDTNYVVITGLGFDSKNNIWALNYGSLDLKTLHVFTNNGNYHYKNNAAGQYLYNYYNLTIDQYDTKWFNSLDPARQGLFYFNENGSYTNTNPSNGILTTNDGLTSNLIYSIVMDTRGDIWVGTGLGVNIISNTQSISGGSAPEYTISNVFPLREYSINCLAVDPINQKWVGTGQGLLLVNSDGSELLASYNTTNSPLLSNNITSITVDKNKGIVYVGTNNGLTSFSTPAIEPKDSFTKLSIYPSPFVLKSGINKVTIDGLIRGCNVKIITLYGKLVKDFSSPGGRVAYWDGTDVNGNLVSSGIYIVVAYDVDGTSVCTGKIAVVRK